MSPRNITWSTIRPLNGGCEKGFEELCAQLARAETPAGARFVRKGTPDGGVECYAVLADGSEWGWQAKYFDVLGPSQWQQLDKSVKSALAKHPKLVRYLICIPLDRADGRIPGYISAQAQWDKHVTKWTKWASAATMTLEFVYWGSSELFERLALPAHVGRRRFWFEKCGFDDEWFAARLNESLKSAGVRYTPEVHVDLPITRDFDVFGRISRVFDELKGPSGLLLRAAGALRGWKNNSKSSDSNAARAHTMLVSQVDLVVHALGSIYYTPTGPLELESLLDLATQASETVHKLQENLHGFHSDSESSVDGEEPGSFGFISVSPRRQLLSDVLAVRDALNEVLVDLGNVNRLAGNSLLLVSGEAGAGKTHLLCDIAKNRIANQLPTVLLMGQLFLTRSPPGLQTRQQLDVEHFSNEEFVGALEAAAQVRDVRALVMIDAINEGEGRAIWPVHLAAFLAQLERSPWIGVVLSVRSSYEEHVVPQQVRARAQRVEHHGFDGKEYDALKTFFLHYGLELPSTPLLAPEFSNPLFLKVLCEGLRGSSERRLPGGRHGISVVFAHFLSDVNHRLAGAAWLDFDARTPLVKNALVAFAGALIDTARRWLTLDAAKKIIDPLRPAHGFEKSLYRQLVVEGLLSEDVRPGHDEPQHIVYFTYERLADHLVAEALLARFPQPLKTLEGDTINGLIEDSSITPGLLESLAILVPERTKRELVELVPQLEDHPYMGRALRHSVIWRSLSAFSDQTHEALRRFANADGDWDSTFEMLITVAMLPDHPYNAEFLHTRLISVTMAERDAEWGRYLHNAWGHQSAVDRLVDWADSVERGMAIDATAIELSAITLTWMLSSSNRFLRDRVTKALVRLLTGRLTAMTRLIERFAAVDDPYIVERVYAVAYGVAMRCRDAVSVAALATSVHRLVFASGSPPPHVLLRDYARGILERARHLDASLSFAPESFRPPYKSIWPTIPSEDEIKPFLFDRSVGSYNSGDILWSRNCIGFSVMDDDFARYIIGTNSSPMSRVWFSLELDKPTWTKPKPPHELRHELIAQLSPKERRAFQVREKAKSAYSSAYYTFISEWHEAHTDDESRTGLRRFIDVSISGELAKELPSDVIELSKQVERAHAKLLRVLSPEHSARLESIEAILDNRQPPVEPRFDLKQIQRYVLKRVFELGWTADLHGHFDRFLVAAEGRSAAKAERIGKKYQWIALHEILAHISDHFQYRERNSGSDDNKYEGPWQLSRRDIDPSTTIRAGLGGTSFDGHASAWWCSPEYNAWQEPDDLETWVSATSDLPNAEELLSCRHPDDDTRWFNMHGYVLWRQDPLPQGPVSQETGGELWCLYTAYLIRVEETDAFLHWAKRQKFPNHEMPEVPISTRVFLGEHGWAPASAIEDDDDGWRKPGKKTQFELHATSVEYVVEKEGFDCSVDENYTLSLPNQMFMAKLGIAWSGKGAEFVDADGRVVVHDPTALAPGPDAMLVRADAMYKLQADEGLTICWAIHGEKRSLGMAFRESSPPVLRLSGAYVLNGTKLKGFVTPMLDKRDSDESAPKRLKTREYEEN